MDTLSRMKDSLTRIGDSFIKGDYFINTEDEFKPLTSTVSLQRDEMYHVFLNFRGKDVRMPLVDHLCRALSKAGLHVFIDSDKLKKGEIIWPALEKAIDNSAIRIPIFSQGYADSAWCLKEAATMLSGPGKTIPLFYDVDPTHVRYPLSDNSSYAKSFRKHHSHPDLYLEEEVDRWRHALEQICSHSGWSMDITENLDPLTKMVVKDVIEIFHFNYQSLEKERDFSKIPGFVTNWEIHVYFLSLVPCLDYLNSITYIFSLRSRKLRSSCSCQMDEHEVGYQSHNCQIQNFNDLNQ